MVALPKAGEVFRSAGIEAQVLETSPNQQATAECLRLHHPATVVTGTSHYESFDSTLWSLARASGIPSCAIIDGWHNTDSRFREGWPDKIFAIDAQQKMHLEEIGAPPGSVECIGHLWLAHIFQTAFRPPSAKGKISQILFISEPIAEDVAKGVNLQYGFDQYEAFGLVKKSAALCSGKQSRIAIHVRLHPYEDRKAWLASDLLYEEKGVTVSLVDAEIPADQSLQGADFVTGISSIVLVQAIALGKPVVSIQPNLCRENTCIAADRGFVETITDGGSKGILRLAQLIEDQSARAESCRRGIQFFENFASDGAEKVIRWLGQTIRLSP